MVQTDSHKWDRVADQEDLYFKSSAFYSFKRDELICLLRKWAQEHILNGKILKTDLMEEALRNDHILFWLGENNQQVFGIDISPKITKYAEINEAALKHRIHLSTADARMLPFQDACFDLIISNSTCDHFPEIDLAVGEMYRVLKPKGTLIMTLHNKFDLTFWLFIVLKKLFNSMPELHYECCYTPRDMRDTLKNCGFVVKEVTPHLCLPFAIGSLLTLLEKNIKAKYNKYVSKLTYLAIQHFKLINEKSVLLSYLSSSLIACKAIKY